MLEHPRAWLRRKDRPNMNEHTHTVRLSISDVQSLPTITVEQAAEILGVGRTAAYEAARRGQLPCRRLGRRVFVPVPALMEWLGVSSAA